jgi:tetratricopeptide (TPR) repeat protein
VSVDLDAELARARRESRPVLVLVTEAGRSPRDDEARALLGDETVRACAADWIVVDLDLNGSRGRAAASRFHAAPMPLVLCLSPHGVVLSRDGRVTRELVLARMNEAERLAPRLDAELEALAIHADSGVRARMDLAEFLDAHFNWHAAIPHFAAVWKSDSADLELRVRAAAAEAQAHHLIGEPEKERHVAEELIATLGATSPAARAAGYYLLGARDLRAQHEAEAVRNLDQAVAAAPDSDFGLQARNLRAHAAPWELK